jgi:S-adenosylmethionine-diacylgycerolhomoserine-N-methlytransferase
MALLNRLSADARVILALLRGKRASGDHAGDLAAFYGPQAEQYDAFRERLLAGRDRMLGELGSRLPADARLVELGCGTGRNVGFLGEAIERCSAVWLVDLCAPLLEVARRRTAGQPNIHCVEGDATAWQPPEPVDAVYLSYALTMIPDWQGTLANVQRMLKPGGLIGVVDFYVSHAVPPPGHARHSAFTRAFWPRWFAHDGVQLDSARLAALEARFETVSLIEARNPVPYMAGLTVPYYVYIGRRRP